MGDTRKVSQGHGQTTTAVPSANRTANILLTTYIEMP